MNDLQRACRKLYTLSALRGKNLKQEFISDNMNDGHFIALLKARLDPYKTYKMSKIQILPPKLEPTTTFEDFMNLLGELNRSNINDKLRLKAAKLLQATDYTYSDIVEGIITKTLSLGVDTGVNKALGYELIPTFKVMLAAPLKEGMEVPIPCQVDIKYDGVRCVTVINNGICTMYTRKGRRLNFPKLEKEILLLSGGEDLMFDGELEMKMRTGISGVCNSNLKKGYTQDSDDLIEYQLFDMMTSLEFFNEDCPVIQSERTLGLQSLFLHHESERTKMAESQTVHSMDKLMEINNKYINEGLEGIIAKDPNAKYFFRRNKSWLKLKAIGSTSLIVVGVTEGEGKRAGKIGALICESSCGNLHVKVGSGLNDEDINFYTKNSPIGKIFEVLFNVVIKGKGDIVHSLFLPRVAPIGIRIDKTEADSLEKILDEHIGKPEIYNE